MSSQALSAKPTEETFSLAPSTPSDILTRASHKTGEAETLIKALNELFPEATLPLKHYQCDGLYAREMFAPAGTLIVGKIHLHDSISFLSMGEALIFSSGLGAQRLTAPATIMAPAGTRRVIVAITDIVFTAVLGTNEKDINVIETTFTVESLDELKLLLENKS